MERASNKSRENIDFINGDCPECYGDILKTESGEWACYECGLTFAITASGDAAIILNKKSQRSSFIMPSEGNPYINLLDSFAAHLPLSVVVDQRS